MKSRSRITVALIGLIVVVAAAFLVRTVTGHETSSSSGKPGAAASQNLPGAKESGLAVKPLSGLPAEAKQTWQLIQHNGPFPNRQDGVVFGNREHRLPAKSSGYYHEYTVKTPGAADRGARRMITGSSKELYYTDDHYASFSVIDPSR